MSDVKRVEVQRLGVTIGVRRVLESVSFDIRAGEVVAIVGRNGTGKSTLIRALLGLLPSTGRLRLGGRCAASLSPRERAALVAYVPQRSGLGVALDVRSVLAQGRYCHDGALGLSSRASRLAIEHAAERLSLGPLLSRPFSTLSGGERARVLLARALVTGASTLLLDEPDAALDIHHALDLQALVCGLAAEGHGVAYVLHRLDDARRFAHRVLVLDGGRVDAFGPVEEVLTADRLLRVFRVGSVPGGATAFELPGAAE